MTTDTALNAWKAWLGYSISRETNSILAALPRQLRDSEEVKTYPGIYISEGSADRVEAGGIMDGNAYAIEVHTQLVTVPGEDEQAATSKAAHDLLRNALSPHVNSCRAEAYVNSQIGIVCFEIRQSSPITTEEDGHRVTTWKNLVVCCMD